MQNASDLGYTFYVHPPEIEFYLLQHQISPPGVEPTPPIDHSGYFDHTISNTGSDFRREAISTLEQMGISVEFSHHEAGAGQQEIDLRYADALSMADNILTFRVVVKEVAEQRGGSGPRSCRSRSVSSPGRACTPTCHCSPATPTPSMTPGPNTTCPGSGGSSSPAC